ncbi:peptide ABC transporter substrate-binding protein [Qingshengfaniella alkalisoli]|uniref:Peptide ABC transporter substrate-binding protein n=1 Tax=Qingshengfaniella alkalisoli TaxID=2599296 RepID=A0A5B8I7D7_9RHOB|nr:peptide ABC transporter substrate-binding protein [Qingshengfaniella alkalisoli]QDY69655.1 peptide ABC transporter substrate-binding protein [Qingshengfaniella alkalisoli]
MIRSPFRTSLFATTVLAASVSAASAVTYVRGNDGDPETLDQHKTSTVAEANILRDLYEGLVVYDPAAQVIPGVAESWEISEDGTVYTFALRDDAKWSNGDPVTANDFVFSLNRIMDPATGAKYANILYPIKGAEAINKGEGGELGVKAVDDHTLEITLEQPTPYFLELLTHQTGLPVHPATVEEFGVDFVQPENMVSNGAFALESVTPNDKIVLQKNAEFHDADNVAIDTVEFTPFEDRANCARRFEAGEVHSCSDIAAEQIADLQSRLGDQVRIAPYLGVYYYGINSAREPFDNVNVRQALSMVIDREFLADEVWAGSMIAAYSWVPPGIGNYVAEQPQLDYADTPLLDREDEAIALLEEAGYGPDNPLEVEISYNTSENHKNVATAIASMWEPLGVTTTFNVRDASAHYAMLRDEKVHDVARAGWIGDYSDPQNFLFLNRADNPGFNYGNYDNPEYDALLDKAAAITDLDERAQVLAEAETMFLRDVPQIPLAFYSSRSLVSPKLQGWEDNIQNVHPTRFLSISE